MHVLNLALGDASVVGYRHLARPSLKYLSRRKTWSYFVCVADQTYSLKAIYLSQKLEKGELLLDCF